MINIQSAIALILGEAKDFGSEEISMEDSYGRILSEDVTADRDYPPFNRSAMDGFALKHSDLSSCTEFKIIEEVHAGNLAEKKISKGTCIKIMTGAPVPEEADLVIKVEDAVIQSDQVSFINTDLPAWSNISKKGEDAVREKILLRRGQTCTPNAISVLAVLGKAKVNVFRIPNISIISTGNELMPPGSPVLPHQIRDSNSFALKGFLMNYRITVNKYLLVRDDKESIKRSLQSVIGSDIIILSGGVSMGDADFVPEALSECNVTNIFHKVAIKPGKPLWFGRTPDKGVVFGLPGNPMSCQVGFKVFIEPYLRKCFSMDPYRTFMYSLSNDRKKKTKLDEYFSCKMITENGKTELQPVKINGSGDILSTLNSDGLALHHSNLKDLQKGSSVYFIPWTADLP
jgi:molybdopterin molybdotransferase